MLSTMCVLYLLLCATASAYLMRVVMDDWKAQRALARVLVWNVLFFALFFGGFYVLGYLELITGARVVSVDHAVWVALLLFLFIPMVAFRKTLRAKHISSDREVARAEWIPQKRVGLVLGILVVAACGVIAVMIGAGYPRGYESQGYHLPIAVHIFQQHSLRIWTVWDVVPIHTFPANASLLFGFLLEFMTEHLVAPAGMIFLMLLGIAVYALGRVVGADGTASLLATLGLVTMPLSFVPATEAAADIGGVAFLAVAAFLVLGQRAGTHMSVLLSGLAAGLACGFKSQHLIAVAFLAIAVAFYRWTAQRESSFLLRSRSVLSGLAVLCGGVGLTGGFWLIRDYVELGNPLYPVSLPFFHLIGWTTSSYATINPMVQLRWVGSSLGWLAYPWVEWNRDVEAFNSHGLGPFFAATVPVALWVSVRDVCRRKVQERAAITFCLAGTVSVLGAWWVLENRQPRYAMGALIFIVPLVAWTVSRLASWQRVAFEWIIACSVTSMLIILVSSELFEFGAHFVYSNQFARSDFYGYPKMIDQLPPGSKVVNLGDRTRNYALTGKHLQNEVIVYSEALSGLNGVAAMGDQAFESVDLKRARLLDAGATHILTEGVPAIRVDGCVRVVPVDAQDTDVLGNRLAKVLTLYAIEYC